MKNIKECWNDEPLRRTDEQVGRQPTLVRLKSVGIPSRGLKKSCRRHLQSDSYKNDGLDNHVEVGQMMNVLNFSIRY